MYSRLEYYSMQLGGELKIIISAVYGRFGSLYVHHVPVANADIIGHQRVDAAMSSTQRYYCRRLQQEQYTVTCWTIHVEKVSIWIQFCIHHLHELSNLINCELNGVTAEDTDVVATTTASARFLLVQLLACINISRSLAIIPTSPRNINSISNVAKKKPKDPTFQPSRCLIGTDLAHT
jgi:hypothetical protein